MEREAKQQLIARLDECLLEHAAALGAKEGATIGNVYDLQDLAAVHYYLKVEHEFTSAEVEALLGFKDPLDVARWCKEDNGHEHSFPICELLHEIDAYQRFPQVMEAGPPLAVRFAELKALLDENLADYKEHMQDCDKSELIERADEIAAAVAAHEYMTKEYEPKADEVDFLLRHDDPLQVVRAFWPERPCELMPMDFVMESLMENMYAPPEERQSAARADGPQEKASVRERLQEAAREAGQRPAPQPQIKGDAR
nr:hypothetical protein [uncultured Eisenbergiella sp.]